MLVVNLSVKNHWLYPAACMAEPAYCCCCFDKPHGLLQHPEVELRSVAGVRLASVWVQTWER